MTEPADGAIAIQDTLATTNWLNRPGRPETFAPLTGRGALSVPALELLMFGTFAVALAGFTVRGRGFAALDGGADA